jgi:hypothetical protein
LIGLKELIALIKGFGVERLTRKKEVERVDKGSKK